MPCFKGIAVSVHAEGAPLAEYSVQKQSRVSRITSYIPVPPAKIPKDSTSNKPEPAKFAISITLLTAGLPVPYSTPKATPTNRYPQPQTVDEFPVPGERGNYGSRISPYVPITKNDNETIAAYIYFDGRPKEEVATLLRPGEETWVNSRWVQVPEAEGGGLAEREFLFREVGLERWLNGLDLEGHDAAAKLERRRQKFEKRRKRKARVENGSDEELADAMGMPKHGSTAQIMRYGNNEDAPVEGLSEEDDSSDDSSDDDAPPQATGQIKVAMFRVLASGEIKRGEYSPQFDAHDDDDAENGTSGANGTADAQDIDHTTSFAKPKTLDPKSISTQTVTGIDGPDKPYATFTFFYRGNRQLQKMGVLESTKAAKATPTSAKRRSTQLDFGEIKPLNTKGTVGFSKFRDNDPAAARNTKSRKKRAGSDAMHEDSEDDDDDEDLVGGKMEDIDDEKIDVLMSAEDVKQSDEISGGVGRIKLKRAHSADLSEGQRKSPASFEEGNQGSVESSAQTPNLNIPGVAAHTPGVTGSEFVGSPLKRAKASLYGDVEDPSEFQGLMAGSVGSTGLLGVGSLGSVGLTSAPAVGHSTGVPTANTFTAGFGSSTTTGTNQASPQATSSVPPGFYDWARKRSDADQAKASDTALPDDEEEL